jgi:hypothetical protein
VKRDRRERRGAAVASILLAHNHVSMQHVCILCSIGTVEFYEIDSAQSPSGTWCARSMRLPITANEESLMQATAQPAGKSIESRCPCPYIPVRP